MRVKRLKSFKTTNNNDKRLKGIGKGPFSSRSFRPKGLCDLPVRIVTDKMWFSTIVQFQDREMSKKVLLDQNGKQVHHIKVYPRAYIEEVTGIDSERRTVTAKFVLFITIQVPDELYGDDVSSPRKMEKQDQAIRASENEGIAVSEKKLRDYVRKHLILEFGYNQTIFIPEHKVCENNPYLIKRIHQRYSKNDEKQDEKYATYSIRGSIECSASFNNMFFPFRKIEVFNHLCFMSQIYGQHVFKYTVMKLKTESKAEHEEQLEIESGNLQRNLHESRQISEQQGSQQNRGQSQQQKLQFLPYFGDNTFGDYVIDNESTLVNVGTNAKVMKKQASCSTLMENIKGVKKLSLHLAGQSEAQQHKHILFKFEMNSLHLSFVLQNEVPIWILSFVTLMLYEAEPSIGGKYSNIILLLVSYISVISNFRINNIEQMGYSFFELKVLALTIVPILLIISTSIDYYRELNFAEAGDVQLLTNPFGIASLVVVFLSFVATLVLLIYIWLHKYVWVKDEKKTQQQKQDLLDWMNMVDLEWDCESKEK